MMKYKKPTAEQVEFFKQRTRQHIDRVVACMRRLEGYADLDTAELLDRAKQHDRDKYTDKDLILPYVWVTEYHRVNNETGAVDEELQQQYDLARAATGQHVKQNRHHPEAHESLADMTNLDLAEMVADWSAMAEELQQGTARGWADQNVGTKWRFTPQQVEFIYGGIDWLDAKPKTKDAMIRYKGHRYREASTGTIYPNEAGGAVNYAVEEIPGCAGSTNIMAEPHDQDEQWLVTDRDQQKVYLVDLANGTHKLIAHNKGEKE